MAFENLTDRFQGVFKKLRRETTITEENVDAALKEIRVALLESDVNFKVVKAFVNSVKEKALGTEVIRNVNPGDQMIKICHDQLEELLGKDNTPLDFKKKPTIIMMVGLQGSGKTTTTGKLAYLAKKKYGKKVLLAGLDVYRPAAIDQLGTLAKSIDTDFFNMGTSVSPVEVAKKAKERCLAEGYDVLILDTAGRLQIDETLMKELVDIENEVHPDEVLLLVDSMAGQEAVNVANSFHEQVHLTGLVMSKLDGDAKGGAALSIKYMTGLPIKFAGVGEKIDELDIFYPDRMADRILGMGDVISLVEKAKENIDEAEAEREAKKMMSGNFTLNDMLKQMKMANKLGSLSKIATMIPGMPKITDEQQEAAKKEMKTFEAIIQSMTPYERTHPECLKNSRKVRIAKGSGKTNADVNRVLKKYEQSKELMKQLRQYRNSPKGGLFR